MTLFFIGIASFMATMLGGLFAIKYKDKLHLVLGFSAGAVIGVVFFDLLPESINLASNTISTSYITTVIAIGFLSFMLIDRYLVRHNDDDRLDWESHHLRGNLGASTLSLHSLLDGLAIGLSFKVSLAVGLVLTSAVLTHDFSDGINTVSIILKNHGSKKIALKWLIYDAFAPIVGILISSLIKVDEKSLAIILAIFCGFFLYLGASDLLPESQHRHPARWTSLMTVLGVGVLYLIVKLIQL